MRNPQDQIQKQISRVRKLRDRFIPPPDGTRWYCSVCGKDLFGIFKAGMLHVKYRERDMLINGVLTSWCRVCGNATTVNTRQLQVNIIHPEDNIPVMDVEEVEGEEKEEEKEEIREEEEEETSDATPQAIELAEREGFRLSEIEGTGKNGRITVGDVRRLLEEV